MKAKLKKAAICFVMAFALLAGMVPMQAHAADPFWGAKYHNSNTKTTNVYINVNRTVTNYTVKTWDFNGDAWFEVKVYNPNGTNVSSNITHINQNEEVPYQLLTNGTVTGTYRVEFKLVYGSGAGWLGTWIY